MPLPLPSAAKLPRLSLLARLSACAPASTGWALSTERGLIRIRSTAASGANLQLPCTESCASPDDHEPPTGRNDWDAANRPSTTVRRASYNSAEAAAGRKQLSLSGRLHSSLFAERERHPREIDLCCLRPTWFQHLADEAIAPLANTMFSTLTRLRRPPSAEQLITRAQRRVRLTDFGDVPFERPLQMFLNVCREQADLSL